MFNLGDIEQIAQMRTRTAVTGTAVLLVLGGGATAYAAVAGGVINACVDKRIGVVRVADTCKTGEDPLSWNQQGVAGPAGPAGPPGPQGPAGEQGPAGPGAAYVGRDDETYVVGTEGPNLYLSADCPWGMRPISGGARWISESAARDGSAPNANWAIIGSNPTGNAWNATFHRLVPDSGPGRLAVFVTCVPEGALQYVP